MTNHEIARRFGRIGDILEIQGENPFKVKAYRRAAEAIDDLVEPLADIEARGALADISGFGEAIIAKTRDFLTTGTTVLYERIKDAVPAGVIAMAAVPGVGPKTAKALHDALGVSSVAELEAACRDGRVRTVAGFGAAKEQNLFEAIERSRRLSERAPLYVALPYAERMVRQLAARPEVGRVEIAGSLRRGRDTVGDIDLVGTSSDPAATMEAFAHLPEVTDVIEIGPAKSAVLTDLGLRADLRLGKPGDFGALLHHFSSGREHNRKLRDLAESRGLKINEYGVFDAKTGEEKSGGADEGEIYAALGLPFVPPELREDNGEIEAAQTGTLPNLVTLADIRGQLHCHSTHSDGSATIREMAEAALARGYEYLAITDHSPFVGVANGLNRDRLLAQMDEIARLNNEFAPRGLTLLTGQEVDILPDGALDQDEDVLARLDVVVASVHRRNKETRDEMTARVLRAVRSPHVDILGHPTGRLLGRREPFEIDMEAVIAAARESGTVLEINAAPERMDLSDVYARRAQAAGVRLVLNADAHSTRGLDLLSWGLLSARRAGLEAADLINTRSLSDLRDLLKPMPAGPAAAAPA